MNNLTNIFRKRKGQYFTSSLLVIGVSLICYLLKALIGYQLVSLLLLITVSVIAMLFDILPVLFAAVLSALIWNFFFIPPVLTFHIDKAEDLLMFLLYFIIALINAVLTLKIRDAESKARDREEKAKTIKLYNTLLNSLSHELRTPIATIIGSVDTLRENKNQLQEIQNEALLNEIYHAGMRLNREVENLLQMSRLESGMLKPSIDWCDVNEMIFHLIQKQPEENQKRIQYKSQPNLPLIKIDGGLISQAIQNLVDNAIHYTPEKSNITITFSIQSGACLFVIADEGKGIPNHEMDAVFEKFYRIPQTKIGGSGLGLSIVKGFVEAHHGKIILANQKNGGAVFTIELPCETLEQNNLENE